MPMVRVCRKLAVETATARQSVGAMLRASAAAALKASLGSVAFTFPAATAFTNRCPCSRAAKKR